MNNEKTSRPRSISFEVEFSGADLERLIIVGSDLQLLRELPRTRLLTHAEVRSAAAILRRLLVDGQLQRLWAQVRGDKQVPYTLEGVHLDPWLDAWPEGWVRNAYAGGAETGVAHHTGWAMSAIPKEVVDAHASVDALIEARVPTEEISTTLFTLDAYLASTCVATLTDELGLVRISRRSVLKYLANQKGGVHFSPGRPMVLPSNPRKNRKEVEIAVLDWGLLRIGHLTGPEYEVMSMAQSVADAQWTGEIVRASEEAVPDDLGGDPMTLRFWDPSTGEWAPVAFSDSSTRDDADSS